jgi:hypothetical protein
MLDSRLLGSVLGTCFIIGSAACAAPADDVGEAPTNLGIGNAVDEEEPVPMLGGRGPAESLEPLAGMNDYRMGDEWGKKPVTVASLGSASEPYRRAARATAKVGGATGFYLGKFAGTHVMATNHHVYSTMSCSGRSVTFPLLDNLRFTCTRMLGTWSGIDLALFEIAVPRAEDEARLASVAANFTFYADIAKGTPLITTGFGVAANSARAMVGNQDSDCRVVSKNAEYRFMSDPDELNPGAYDTWSFSHTCDISHGDSGSAMVDRNSGRPIGIVWTGRIPKNSRVQASAYLEQAFTTDHADVWTEMNYAVPATKMREHIASVIAAPATPEATRRVLSALIAPEPSTAAH